MRKRVQVTVPLQVADSKLSRAGQYQYPFRFELPASMPPSLDFSDGATKCAAHPTFDRVLELKLNVGARSGVEL